MIRSRQTEPKINIIDKLIGISNDPPSLVNNINDSVQDVLHPRVELDGTIYDAGSHVATKFKDISVIALIDTGCNEVLIRSRLYNEIKAKNPHQLYINEMSAVGLSKSYSLACGNSKPKLSIIAFSLTEDSCSIKYSTRAIVCENLNNDIIISRNFMRDLGITTNVRKKSSQSLGRKKQS